MRSIAIFGCLLLAATLILAGQVLAEADHMLITEFCVTPTPAEFIEIYHPGDTLLCYPLDSLYFITDATYAPDTNYYYNIVLQNGSGGAAGATNFYDFNAHFPPGSEICGGEYQVIAFRNTDFNAAYGFDADYELIDTDPGVPNMIPAEDGSIDDNAGLTNGGEVLILYKWDWDNDLVKDVDYVLWGNKLYAVDKTDVSIDGIDAGTDSSTYNDDTDTTLQTLVNADNDGDPDPHDYGKSAQRSSLDECGETSAGGNGVTGNDETSEDLTFAAGCWDIDGTPTPGGPPGLPTFEDVTWDPCVPTALQPVTVTAEVTDDTGVDSVKITYTVNGGAETTAKMTSTVGDSFQYTIPGQSNGARVEFTLQAIDADDNVVDYPFTNGYFSGLVTIASVRPIDVDGRNIYEYYGARVAGVVTGVFSPPGPGVDFYIQDKTAGIKVYDFEDATVVDVGDSVVVAGVLDQYNGTLEISPCQGTTFIAIVGAGTVPQPQTLTLDQFGEDYEGELVKVVCVDTVVIATWPAEGEDANIFIKDCTDSLDLRIDKETDIDGSPEPTWHQNVIGICNQYDFSPPYDGYYQLMPRSIADFDDTTCGPCGTPFVRADVQADGDQDLFDAIYLLNWLGGINPEPQCVQTADVQNDNDTDLFDAIYLLNWLGGINPPPQAPCCDIPEDCGLDPDAGPLSCNSYPPCGAKVADKTAVVGDATASRLVVQDGQVILANAEPILGFAFTVEYDSPEPAKFVDNAGLVTEGFAFFVGNVNEPGVVRVVALADLDMGDGVDLLPAGEHVIARIPLGRDASVRIVNSVIALDEARALNHQVMAKRTLPTEFELSQNYPNPFNPATEIAFALPRDGQVSITVYNIVGERVANLVDGEMKAGHHKVRWNAESLTSGVYFCRMEAGSFTSTRKMVVIK